METSNVLNSLGLIIDIIGVILIFCYGISPMLDVNGSVYFVSEQVDEDEKKKAMKYKSLSRLGLMMVIVGFILQLISNFI